MKQEDYEEIARVIKNTISVTLPNSAFDKKDEHRITRTEIIMKRRIAEQLADYFEREDDPNRLNYEDLQNKYQEDFEEFMKDNGYSVKNEESFIDWLQHYGHLFDRKRFLKDCGV